MNDADRWDAMNRADTSHADPAKVRISCELQADKYRRQMNAATSKTLQAYYAAEAAWWDAQAAAAAVAAASK